MVNQNKRPMNKKTGDYYGKIFLSNNCGFYQIVLANTTERMKAMFINTNSEVYVNASQVDAGGVTDPLHRSVCGVGFLDGESSTDFDVEVHTREYSVWRCMLDQCYGSRQLSSYELCYVSDEFHSFKYFKGWYESQVGYDNKSFQLDKDILGDGVVKVYAEDVCVLVPSEINMFFAKAGAKRNEYPIGVNWHVPSGKFASTYNNGGEPHLSYHDNEWSAFLAYKRAKETRAKELAEKWRGQIDDRVYKKLINYKVLLTD